MSRFTEIEDWNIDFDFPEVTLTTDNESIDIIVSIEVGHESIEKDMWSYALGNHYTKVVDFYSYAEEKKWQKENYSGEENKIIQSWLDENSDWIDEAIDKHEHELEKQY